MDRLPVEIILQITAHLTYSEKKRLSATCHHLRDIISNSNLFSEIAFTWRSNSNEERFLQEVAPYARHVHSFRLHRVEASIDAANKIPQLFPNLRDFSCNSTIYDNTGNITLETAQSWRILHCLEAGSDASLFYLDVLKMGGLCNLTKLTINLGYRTSCSTFVSHLQNASRLEYLHLSSQSMALVDLELLHQNEPNLQSLYIYPNVLIPGTTRRNFGELDIANSLKELRVQFNECRRDLLKLWMEYMVVKYKNMERLMINSIQPHKQSLCKSKLAEILFECSRLTTYQVDIIPIEADTLRAMDQSGVQLKSITIYKYNVWPQLGKLLASNQRQYLEEIVIVPSLIFSTVNNMSISQPHTFQAWHQFENLEHLDIHLSSGGNSLGDVLINLQHIQSLTIRNCSFGVNQTSAFTTFRAKLKKLTLNHIQLTENGGDVFAYIAKVCPNLTHLAIENCRRSGILKIDFPQHRFVSIRIAMDYTRVIYKVKNEKRAAVYEFKDGVLQGTIPLDETPYVQNLSAGYPVPRICVSFKECVSLRIGEALIPNW